MLAKIPSPHKIVQLTFQPEMFSAIKEGSLLVADNIFLENLLDTAVKATQEDSFRRCGLLLLVGAEVLDSSDMLTQLNLSLRSLWSSTAVVIKPWTGGIARTDDDLPSSPPPFRTLQIGLAKASRCCPSY